MKILVFCPYYPPHTGGLENYAEELHKQLAARGHDVTVFTPNIPPTSDYQYPDGINVIHFPAFDIIYNYPLPKFWRYKFWQQLMGLFQRQFDVIFSVTRFFNTSLLALIYAKLKNRPWLHIEHGSDYVKSDNIVISLISRLFDEIFGRLVFKFSSINVAPSKSAQSFIKKFDSRPVPVIYRGLDYNKIDSITPNLQHKKEFSDKTIITFAGRFINSKGLPDLIKAVSQIPNNNITLLLIGDGHMTASIKQLIYNIKPASQISLLGKLPPQEVVGIFKSSDIIVNPSYNEGLPTTILEAAACGKAIIATGVGGTGEIIKHNISGILIKPKDIKALREKLTLLIDNPKLRHRLGIAAKQSVRQKFNWQTTTDEYEKILERLLTTHYNLLTKS